MVIFTSGKIIFYASPQCACLRRTLPRSTSPRYALPQSTPHEVHPHAMHTYAHAAHAGPHCACSHAQEILCVN
jgi:hypothetical protein